jgi:hypothetical protein
MTLNPLARYLGRAIAGVQAGADTVTKPRKFPIIANDEEDGDENPDNNPDRLKVLVDPDAQKLVMKIFQQYVSEEDYAELVMFIKDFDALLAKFRKGKPLSREEIEDIEEETGFSGGKGKKGSGDTMGMPSDEGDDDGETEDELASDEDDDFESDDSDTDDSDDDEDEDELPSVVVASFNGPQPLHEVIAADTMGFVPNLSIPLIGLQHKITAAYEPKYDTKTGEFTDVPYQKLAARLIIAGYKRGKPEPDVTGAYRIVAFGRGTDRIDVWSFGDDEQRMVRAVVLVAKQETKAEGFKVCNECTGGTAPACKANEKCMDKAAKKAGTGPYAE